MKRKMLSLLLCAAMLMTFIPTFSQLGTSLTVYATDGTGSDSDDSELGGGTGSGGGEAGSGGFSGTEGDGTEVSYLAPVYEDGKIMFDENNDVVFETKMVTDYIVAEDIAYGGTITSADQMPTIGTSGETAWYVADSDIEWNNFVLVQGDVHLVICDDITITSIYGLVVSNGNSLTIYGQENGTGKLNATGIKYSGGFYSAAIGGCDVTTEMANSGTITINGCQITATASSNGAAIGGGNGGHGGNIIINGGTVSAKGAAYSTAIGGGSRGNSGNITINGGIVSAETSGSSSAIGAGYVRYSSTGESLLAKTDKIEINGGTVVATHTDNYEEYPVIGGLYGFDNINISGGHITVSHARSGGIGIGTNSVTVMEFDGNLNISGGTIISGNDKTLYLGAGKTSSSAKGTVDVVVTGGNISGTFKNVSTLTDGKSAVEMKEITIAGAEDQTEVTVLEDYPIYGLCDVVTDGDKVVIYVPVSKAYTVTISDTIANGTVTADVSEAAEGDTVTLTVTPNDGFMIDTISYNDGTDDIEITETGGVYTFIMPAADVTVAAEFKNSQTIYSIVGDFNSWDVSDTSYTMTMNSDGKYVIATEIEGGNREFKIAKDYDWTGTLGISDTQDAISNGETVALVEDGLVAAFELSATSEVTFVFDPVAMTITVSWEEYVPALFEVIIAETQNGSVSASPDFTVPGDTVILIVTPDENYEIGTITCNDGTEDIEITEADGDYTFTMPANDVTVSATFVVMPPEVAWGADKDNLTESGTIDEAIAAGAAYIKLQRNIDRNETIQFNNSVTLDLNGKAFMVENDQNVIGVYVIGDLTVTDSSEAGNGSLTGTSVGSYAVYANNITVHSGNLYGKASGEYAVGVYSYYSITVDGKGTLKGRVDGNNGNGVASNSGNITIVDEGMLTGIANGDYCQGIMLTNANITVENEGTVIGTSVGENSFGAVIYGSFIIKGKGKVTCTGANAAYIDYKTESSYAVESEQTDAETGLMTNVYVAKPAPISFVGAQIRMEGEQGLRFIFSMSKDYYETLTHPESYEQTGEGFGGIMLPAALLDGSLTKETEYAAVIPAVKLYQVTETEVLFTICITNVDVENYEREVVATSYVTDSNGNTAYGEQSEPVSIYEVAEYFYNLETSTSEEKQYLLEKVLNKVDPEKYPIA